MLTSPKTKKELAYLYDLFVATDWGKRFSQLLDEHLELPKAGDAIYVGAGTGGHALALQERAGEKVKLLGLDENAESIELAHAKALAVKESVEFRYANTGSLPTADDAFDLVIGDASLISVSRIDQMLRELIRSAKPNATVAFMLPTASSFGEFFSVYWEALHNCGLIDHEGDVERLILQLPTVSDLEEIAKPAGLEEVMSWTQREEFDFESGEAFLAAPLIADFLMQGWLESVPGTDQERVATEVARVINEDRHEAEFALTVKATLLVGRKALVH